MSATVRILDPRVASPAVAETQTWSVDGPIRGTRIGLRLDDAWRSYITVVDEWQQLLADDGAVVHVWMSGNRNGPGAAQTRSDLDEWSRLIDVGVVGLGN